MEFRVTTSDEMTAYYHGESRYKIEDNGVLLIRDEGGKEIRHSPSFWQTIEHDAGERSKGRTGRGGRVTVL